MSKKRNGRYTLENIKHLCTAFESYDGGIGLEIAKKCQRHYKNGDTNISFSGMQKDFMRFKLESPDLTEGELSALRLIVGGKNNV